MSRSMNPDLIFDDVLGERAERVAVLYLEGGLERADLVLDRVTLFVTHRCNLRCRYCNGPHMDSGMDPGLRREMLGADMDLGLYVRLLSEWAGHGLRHLHFTGGEPTLHPLLVEFTRLASREGIPCTVTTNGTASPEFYRDLVTAGMTEFRISMDSTDDSTFDGIVGVPGACQRVKETIATLVEMRQTHPVFIILNACIGSFNVGQVGHIIESLTSLGPDDVKILLVAEEALRVCSKASRSAVDELLCRAHDMDKGFELLDKKIRRLFRRSAIGLEDLGTRHAMTHCFVPLTERTLDGRGFFPCSIYLRYKGEALAPLAADYTHQQRAMAEFVKGHDCKEDVICKANCTNCCKEFNVATSRIVCKVQRMRQAKGETPIEIPPVETSRIQKVRRMYARIMETEAGPVRPLMVIKPLGMPHRDEITSYIESQGVTIESMHPISDWHTFSLFLYLQDAKGEQAAFKIARNMAFAEVEENEGLLLVLELGVPEGKVMRIRREIRDWYGEALAFMRYQERDYLLRSNVIHASRFEDLERDCKVARFLLG